MPVLTLARRLLAALEPIATLTWFSPESFEELGAAGFPGWAGYFCSRAAPLGPIPPEVAIALFYNWNPQMIHRELRWDAGSPQDARDAFVRAAGRAYDRVLGSDIAGSSDIVRAAVLLRTAVEGSPLEGRPIFAGYRALPWPSNPAVALWHGAMTLREFRGDTHVAVLVSHGLGPIDALLLNAPWVEADRQKYLGSREWTIDDAQPAIERLTKRALLNGDGALTDGGMKFREMVEIDTDRRAAAPVEALTSAGTEEALSLIEPVGRRILEARAVPGIVGRVARGVRRS